MAKRAAAKAVAVREVAVRKDGHPMTAREDGWTNILSGHGVVTKDKRLSSAFASDILSYEECQELYRGNDTCARIVEEEPGAMIRSWLKVLVGEDPAATSSIKTRLEELEVRDRIESALNWARAYGGAAIVLGADDGQRNTLALPLNMRNIRSFDWLTAYDCSEIQVASWYDQPSKAKYGEPRTYRLVPKFIGTAPIAAMANLEIHESRVVQFQGVVTNREMLRANQFPGWGDSVLGRPNRILRDYDIGWDSVAAILQEFAIATYAIEGLANLVATRQDAVVKKRVELIMLQKSVMRGVLMDAKESFKRETVPLSGVADILDRFAKRMAAAASMPVVVLMGESPAGLNATGAQDVRQWYDRVAAKRPRMMGRPLERILEVLFAAKNGPTRGKTPEDWTIEYGPLWQMTALEDAELRNKQSQTDKAYVEMGAVTPEEVAVSRFPAEGYNAGRMVVDLELREKVLSQMSEDDLAPAAPPPSPGPLPAPEQPPPEDEIDDDLGNVA